MFFWGALYFLSSSFCGCFFLFFLFLFFFVSFFADIYIVVALSFFCSDHDNLQEIYRKDNIHK